MVRGASDFTKSRGATPDPARPEAAASGAQGSMSGRPGRDALDRLLAGLQEASDTAARRAAALALTEWCRDHIIDGRRLGEVLRSPLPRDAQTRLVGELRAEIARNEFLLGWAFAGGVFGGNWEQIAANRGIFPDYYMETVATHGRENGAMWCTSFAGHTATRLGFEATPGNAATSMFWSGYRLELWAREGTLHSGARVTPRTETVAAARGSSALIRGSDWHALHTTITMLTHNRTQRQSDAAHTAALGRAVDDFFAGRVQPQAGDMLIHDSDNKIRGNSHTNLVERYDAKTHTMYTIGGNEGQAVGGRRVVLTNPAEIHKLAALVRIGAEFYTGPRQGTGTADVNPAPGALMLAARAINTRIAPVLHELGQIRSGDGNATALEWQTGRTSHNPGTSDT